MSNGGKINKLKSTRNEMAWFAESGWMIQPLASKALLCNPHLALSFTWPVPLSTISLCGLRLSVGSTV